MKKISGILPADKRITTVDLRSGGTARPGMPSFGRPVGPSPEARTAFFANQAAMQRLQDQRELASKRDQQAAIVKRMADQFFVQESHTDSVRSYRSPVEQPMLSQTDIISPMVRSSRENLPLQMGEPSTIGSAMTEMPSAVATNGNSASGNSSGANDKSVDPRDQLVAGQHLDVRA